MREFLGSRLERAITSVSGQAAQKGHKVKDGALKMALSPIAICALLPIGVEATMPASLSAVAKVTELERSITT